MPSGLAGGNVLLVLLVGSEGEDREKVKGRGKRRDNGVRGKKSRKRKRDLGEQREMGREVRETLTPDALKLQR